MLLVTIMAVACAPTETVTDPTAPTPAASKTPESDFNLPSPTAVPTRALPAEDTGLTPVPSITLELMPEATAKPAPEKEIPIVPEKPTAQPPDDPQLQALIDRAKADLAQRLDIPVEEIVLDEFRLVTWSDASLGCPEPGMAYAQVLVDGYLIMLRAGLGIYNYHGGGYPDRGPFLCEGIGSKIIVPPPAGSADI